MEITGQKSYMEGKLHSFRRLAGPVVLLCVSMAVFSCAKKDADLVYRAYESAAVSPEGFDSYAAEHLFARAVEFETCTELIRSRLAERLVRATEQCTGLPPEYQNACSEISESDVEKTLEAMLATAHQQALYAQTPPGQGAAMGKQMLGAGQWEKMQRRFVSILRPALLCD